MSRAQRSLGWIATLLLMAQLAGCANRVKPEPRYARETPPEARAAAIRSASDTRSTETRNAKPKKIANPKYPDIARQHDVEGVVVLEVTVSAEGEVESVKVLRTKILSGSYDRTVVREFESAASEAVLQWIYSPALSNGEPVPDVQTVPFSFTMNR